MMTPDPASAVLSYQERTELREQLSKLGLETSEIQEQIRHANETDSGSPDWRQRANGAIAAKRRQISDIKLPLGRDREARRAISDERRAAARRRPRYVITGGALASVKLLVRIFLAACEFVDDDSDEHFDELLKLVEQGRALGLEPEGNHDE